MQQQRALGFDVSGDAAAFNEGDAGRGCIEKGTSLSASVSCSAALLFSASFRFDFSRRLT